MSEHLVALHYTAIAPLLAAVAVACLARWLLPRLLAERYCLGLALASGFFVGYWLLPDDWTPLLPTKHLHWLPYVAVAGVLGGVVLAGGVSWVERLLAYAALSLFAAWQLVPLWDELVPPRPYCVPLLAGYMTAISALLVALPDRLLGLLFSGLLTISAAAVAVLVAADYSLKYGQLAAVGAATLTGCLIAAVITSLTRRASEARLLTRSVSEGALLTRSVSEGSVPPPLATSLRGLAPVYAILVGGLAFVGTIGPTPPLWHVMLAPAAPLALWLFAAGPLARLKGWPAIAAQTAVVLAPLALLAAWAALTGE